MKLKLLLDGKQFQRRLHARCSIRSRSRLELACAAAVDQGGDAARHRHRGVHRGQDADDQGDAEAADRAGAERGHRHAGQQRGDVGVGDGAGGLVVAGGDAGQRRVAVAQLLADSLVDQHVGVHRHADGQRDAGKARQGQRGAEQRHHRDHHQQVEQQREVGDDAEHLVVDAGRTPART